MSALAPAEPEIPRQAAERRAAAAHAVLSEPAALPGVRGPAAERRGPPRFRQPRDVPSDTFVLEAGGVSTAPPSRWARAQTRLDVPDFRFAPPLRRPTDEVGEAMRRLANVCQRLHFHFIGAAGSVISVRVLVDVLALGLGDHTWLTLAVACGVASVSPRRLPGGEATCYNASVLLASYAFCGALWHRQVGDNPAWLVHGRRYGEPVVVVNVGLAALAALLATTLSFPR